VWARKLLTLWHTPDDMARAYTEVIASAFASGLTWSSAHGDRPVYCPSPGLKGSEALGALERFLGDHPDMADRTYGDPLAASLALAFPCTPK